MASPGRATPARQLLRSWSLDTSNGIEFIQKRLALLAQIIVLIGVAFLVIAVTISLLPNRMPFDMRRGGRPTIAHVGGLILLSAVWLACRRRRLSLRALEALDAATLIGGCVAWSQLIIPSFGESIYGAVSSVTMTVLARAILVPSTAARTLRLTSIAVIPLLAMMWLTVDALPDPGTIALDVHAATYRATFQTLFVVAVVWMATITSRTLYDLRRSLSEANELGSYALEEKLGSGGMGEVWRARHRFLVREAAVKLIRPELLTSGSGDPQVLLRRFEREARATAALRSPHTVQLYDFGQAEDGTLFYVMEMLVGIDLEQLVKRYGPVPAERVVHILKQVCHSLDEAHQNGLVHRDIKPANIFVSGIGTEVDFVKVLDFGLVRALPPDPAAGERGKLTVEGSLAGTPAYTAPEIAMGEVHYDHRVDLYAVGCVGYWLLTGSLVFDGDTAMKMMMDHARTPARPPRSRTELPIPAEVEKIIMDCLEKEPERRPSSAAELAERLAQCKLPEQWTGERAARWWRSHLPQPPKERPVAELLLSREDGAPGVRELHRRQPER